MGDEDDVLGEKVLNLGGYDVKNDVDYVDLISSLWPIFVGFITLVIILGKLHADVDVLKEKVRTLFELWNKKE